MLTFLEETIIDLQENQEDLSQCIIILPSKRAGGFFKHYLQKHIKGTSFAPKIISIEQFIEELSSLTILSPDELLIKSYLAYSQTKDLESKDTYEEYAAWANAILNDFSELDRYLVPQKEFFDYLTSIKTLEKWGASQEESSLVKKYLSFWNRVLPFYQQLNENLLQEQLGYQGMVYRKAAEDIEHYIAHQKQPHIFIGFNALNIAEQHIIQALLEEENTKVYWDIDQHFFQDKEHSASHFIRQYLEEWKYYQTHTKPVFSTQYTTAKEVSIIPSPNNNIQVKAAAQLLSTYTIEELNNTAVVLADESLLIPMLYSLPSNVSKVNVTMGIPLHHFDTFSFFELFIKHQIQLKEKYYYKDIVALINHPFSAAIFSKSQEIITKISEDNFTYITYEKLAALAYEKDKNLIQLLFGPWKADTASTLLRCKQLVKLAKIKEGKTIEKLVLVKLEGIFEHIEQLLVDYAYLKEISTFSRLFSDLLAGMSLDLEGDAYNGLQIMGLLETRGLDFKNIIMLSVNEGILPSGKSNSSFITYDLKKQFNLPFYTEKDAVYTYHFYRLLQRAQNATFLYNSFSTGLQAGEKSRFLLQLEIEKIPTHNINLKTIATPISLTGNHEISVEKNPEVLNRLQAIAGSYFSPSALTSYIRNPVEFYKKRVLKLNEFNTVEEIVAHNTLGSIVHQAMENLYKPLEGELLTVEVLHQLKEKVPKEISTQFKHFFKQGDPSIGKNLIIFEVAKQYVNNLISLDITEIRQGNTVKIIGLEVALKTKLKLPEIDFPVFLGGSIDRIDLYNEELRIIDYKTGKVTSSDLEIVHWELLSQDYKFSKAFQILAYSFLALHALPYHSLNAGVISFKNLSAGFMPFAKKEKEGKSSKNTLINLDTITPFVDVLHQVIIDICNMDTPFIEKEISS